MSRAEMRRKSRETSKSTKTYQFTQEQLMQFKRQEYERARSDILKHTDDLAEEILEMMLVIPTNVLVNDYWPGTAKKRIPKFIRDCLSLYNAWQEGQVSMEEMQELTAKYGNMELVDKKSVTYRTLIEQGQLK